MALLSEGSNCNFERIRGFQLTEKVVPDVFSAHMEGSYFFGILVVFSKNWQQLCLMSCM